jgi:hypothetical protein
MATARWPDNGLSLPKAVAELVERNLTRQPVG